MYNYEDDVNKRVTIRSWDDFVLWFCVTLVCLMVVVCCYGLNIKKRKKQSQPQAQPESEPVPVYSNAPGVYAFPLPPPKNLQAPHMQPQPYSSGPGSLGFNEPQPVSMYPNAPGFYTIILPPHTDFQGAHIQPSPLNAPSAPGANESVPVTTYPNAPFIYAVPIPSPTNLQVPHIQPQPYSSNPSAPDPNAPTQPCDQFFVQHPPYHPSAR